jgi:hypothetical protein
MLFHRMPRMPKTGIVIHVSELYNTYFPYVDVVHSVQSNIRVYYTKRACHTNEYRFHMAGSKENGDLALGLYCV